MRLFLFTLLFLFLSFTVWSQENWSFGINAQVGLTGSTDDKVNETYLSSTSRRYTTIKKNPLMAATGAGLWANYQISKVLGVRSGISYLNSGNRSSSVSYSEMIITGETTLDYEETIDFRMHQLQVPLELVINPGKGQISPVFSLGVQFNQAWLNRVFHSNRYNSGPEYARSWDQSNSTLASRQPLNIQPVASIGIRLNDQMTISLRRTWAKELTMGWLENDHDYSSFDPSVGIMTCGIFNFYQTTSSHLRLTSLQFSYCIY